MPCMENISKLITTDIKVLRGMKLISANRMISDPIIQSYKITIPEVLSLKKRTLQDILISGTERDSVLLKRSSEP